MNEIHDSDCAVAATTELIGSRTLSERLDMLEREGIVTRRSFPGSPPRVER
jgi:DNA-binding HxlR family transcriptional regulator